MNKNKGEMSEVAWNPAWEGVDFDKDELTEEQLDWWWQNATFVVQKSELLSNNFVVTPRDNYKDPKLTGTAYKLLMNVLDIQEQGERISVRAVREFMAEGRDALYNALDLLIELGYVHRHTHKVGNLWTHEYMAFDYPHLMMPPFPENPEPTPPFPENQDTDFPVPDFPYPENPEVGLKDQDLSCNTIVLQEAQSASHKNKTKKSKPKPEPGLPSIPGTTIWPKDISELAVAFAKKLGRDPYKWQVREWIVALRVKFLPLNITVRELERMYDLAQRQKTIIKSPNSIFFMLDLVRPPAKAKAQIVGKTEDGGTLMRYPDGAVGTVYGD